MKVTILNQIDRIADLVSGVYIHSITPVILLSPLVLSIYQACGHQLSMLLCFYF